MFTCTDCGPTTRRHAAHGRCTRCDKAWRLGYQTRRAGNARLADAVIEDATWIADNGGSLSEAARRLGFPSGPALERQLARWEQRDLAARLRNREPLPIDSGKLNSRLATQGLAS